MAMQNLKPLDAVLRQDLAIVLAGVLGIAALTWAYMLYLAWDMEVEQYILKPGFPGGFARSR